MTKVKDAVGQPRSAAAEHEPSDTMEQARGRLLEGLPVTERRMILNGTSTAVLEGGNGTPVVLLHGPSELAAKWGLVIPGLVQRHRVIAPDLPGHGGSPITDGPASVELILGWLDELITRTCSSPPAVVGSLLGGAIAARFATTRSDRLRHLVLVDALGLTTFQPAPAFGASLNAFYTAPSDATFDQLWDYCADDVSRVQRGLGDRWADLKAYSLAHTRTPELRGALWGLMEQFALPAIPAEALARIRVPTTLVWGRQDRATPVTVAQELARRHGWPLRVIEDSGDDPALEQPEALLAVLREVLEDGAASAAPRADSTAARG